MSQEGFGIRDGMGGPSQPEFPDFGDFWERFPSPVGIPAPFPGRPRGRSAAPAIPEFPEVGMEFQGEKNPD